jgi:hypothetical protein
VLMRNFVENMALWVRICLAANRFATDNENLRLTSRTPNGTLKQKFQLVH